MKRKKIEPNDVKFEGVLWSWSYRPLLNEIQKGEEWGDAWPVNDILRVKPKNGGHLKTSKVKSRRQTKKERIHQLVSDGQYTDEDIARMVGTTIPNVWKEKTTLRKSGVLAVTRSDRTLLVTSAAQGVYATQKKTASLEYQELLNIPPIDSEGMKKLYTSIIAGKKPGETIAAYGFHRRSQKVRQDILSKRIIYEVLVLKTSAKGTALIDKYNEEGSISDDDMIELLKEYTQSMFQLGMQVVPAGFRAVY